MSELFAIEQRPSGSGAVPWILDEEGRRTQGYDDDRRIAEVQAGLFLHSRVRRQIADAGAQDVERALYSLHDAGYIKALRQVRGAEARLLAELAEPGLQPDTPVHAAAIATAEQGVATAIAAAERILDGAWLSYALCRPPGHHAGPSWLGGYCYYNNAAIAAKTLTDGGLGSVAVLDLDIHYPNGTSALICRIEGASLHSIHGCTGANLPWDRVRPRSERERLLSFRSAPSPQRYLLALSQSIEAIRQRSTAIVLSLGYDIVAGDPHGAWSFQPSIFEQIGGMLAEAGLPVCVVQEGGYAFDSLAECSHAFANGLLGSNGR